MSNKRRIYESRYIKKYAHTLLKYGVNLQEDQTLVISVDVENKDFAVIVTEEAYELGAKRLFSTGDVPLLLVNVYYMLTNLF